VFPLHDQPTEQQYCREHRERSADGKGLADVAPGVNEPTPIVKTIVPMIQAVI